MDTQRRAAVADERQRDAGQRHDLDDAADDDERLHADDRREADGEQLLERVVGAQRGAQAGADEQQVGHQHGRRAEQAELLADRREDEVVLRLGHLCSGCPRPRPVPAMPPSDRPYSAWTIW